VSAEVSPAGAPLEIERLERLPGGAVDRVREIYEEAFPLRQRVPFAELLQAAADGDEIALVALEDGRPAGLAFLSGLEAAGCLFLEYFAVARDLRGGGRGQALWRAVAAELAGPEGRPPVVLEVEDPAEPQIDDVEAAHRARRVRFWQRVGATTLAVDGYVVPNVGTTGTEPLCLMWIAARAGDPQPDGQRLLELVLALYDTGYGLASDDPLVRRARELWGS
jgi:GNAT superfamily N-acetyltransferase